MVAPLIGKRVLISGLRGRPELNEKYGRAESFNDATNRYNVRIDVSNETIALKPANLHSAASSSTDASSAAGRGMAGVGLRSVEPKTVAGVIFLALTYLLGFSMLNAGLLSGLGYVLFLQCRQHGVIKGGRELARRGADAVHRITGMRMTPAQAAFILVSVAGLISYYWLWPAPPPPEASNHQFNRHRETAASSSYGSSSRQRSRGAGYDASEYESYSSGGGFFGSGWDLSLMISAGMLGSMVWRMGGGPAGGWSLDQFWHKLKNMDMFQMMMLLNLAQSVFGGGRRGMGRGFGGRARYY